MNPRSRPPVTALALPEQHLGTIRQSHERCTALGLPRIGRPEHDPLGRTDLLQVRERHHRLHAHAAPVMEMLFGQIEGTQSMVVLCDSAGTIIHSIGDDDFLSRASKVALKAGVNWSEQAKGTNAIGTALIAEEPTLVHAGEHYMHANHFLTCSAAPIFDPRGNILGVLDVTGDHRSYHPHTMALVKLSARMIENHWLGEDHRHGLRLHFHHRADFIGTLMEGILAVSPDGRVVGANRGALELLGLPGAGLRRLNVQSLFGLSVAALAARSRQLLAPPLRVHGQQGQAFHVQARFNAPVAQPGQRGAESTAPALPAAALPAMTQAAAPAALEHLLSGDPQMAALVDKLRRVLPRAVPVVIVGETGTGKGLLARALHQDSTRRDGPFVAVACGAVDEADLDTAFHQAQGGTLLLDGVAELPAAQQLRLLHLLHDSSVALVSTAPVKLQPGTGPGQVREDLFHRLQGLAVKLPALRERSDLAALARHILDSDVGTRGQPLTAAALAQLQACHWPGNVRQLQTVLLTAALLAGPGLPIAPEHLPEDLVQEAPAENSLGQIERRAMEQALQAAQGNVSLAARQLGVSRNTLYRRLHWGASAKN